MANYKKCSMAELLSGKALLANEKKQQAKGEALLQTKFRGCSRVGLTENATMRPKSGQ